MLLPKTLLTICSVWLLNSFCFSNALIVPQELPSILSLVYSNIPPIKKGTDSRLGFGFRLGEHADFQVMLELGPQKETRPVGEQDSNNSFNKRHITKTEQNALLRQQLRQYLQQQQQQQQQQQTQSEPTSTERNAVSWLETWSQDMNTVKKQKSKSKSKPEIKKQQLLSTPILPAQSLQQLQMLYKMATTTPQAETPSKVLKDENLFDPLSLAEHLKKKKQITKELMDVRLEADS